MPARIEFCPLCRSHGRIVLGNDNSIHFASKDLAKTYLRSGYDHQLIPTNECAGLYAQVAQSSIPESVLSLSQQSVLKVEDINKAIDQTSMARSYSEGETSAATRIFTLDLVCQYLADETAEVLVDASPEELYEAIRELADRINPKLN